MTRFWITLTQGVDFVLRCFDLSRGGELFVPKIPSMNIMDLASVIAPDAKYEFIGIRPGEKLHEIMISKDDAINTLEFNDYYVIQPAQPWWDDVSFKKVSGGTPVVDSFEYSSDQNPQWLTKASLKAMLSE